MDFEEAICYVLAWEWTNGGVWEFAVNQSLLS
jgi:hypothetical protein